MSIRRRIFLLFVLLISAGAYWQVNYLLDDIRPRYLEAMEESLVDQSVLLAEWVGGQSQDGVIRTAGIGQAIERAHGRGFQAKIYDLTKENMHQRVYVTDAKGMVVFDSAGTAVGHDYSQWNDVYLTLQGKYGARATRIDPRDEASSVLYIAAPIMQGEDIIGVLTVGKSARNVHIFIAQAKRKLVRTAVLVAGVSLLVTFIIAGWISQPIERLMAHAQKVSEGQRDPLPRIGPKELRRLGKAFEDMRDALEGKDYVERYIQTLTHEMKSPLAAIRGSAELLGEGDMPSEDRQRFTMHIRREVHRLQDVIDRMLELAGLEKRKGLQATETVDVGELTRDVLNSLEPLIATKSLQVTVDMDAETVQGETFLIRQAMRNGLDNAIRFSPEGGALGVGAKVADGQLVWWVTDEGPGVPDYAQARVFERFYVAGDDPELKGTGLGLAFVREVLNLHGGHAELVNRPEGGTCFSLYFPHV